MFNKRIQVCMNFKICETKQKDTVNQFYVGRVKMGETVILV